MTKILRGWRNFSPDILSPDQKLSPDFLIPDQNFYPIPLSPTKTFTRFFFPDQNAESKDESDFSLAVVAQENTEDARSDDNENSVIVLD